MQGGKLAKIVDAFTSLHSLTKKFITHGTRMSLLIFAAGVVLIISNGTLFEYSIHYYKTAILLMKNSFSVLAGTIIGCLLVDHLFQKSNAS